MQKNKTIQGKDADFNRRALENKTTKALILNHKITKYDKLYQRDSGLNHVLCKIAKKNNIEFQLDINELTNSRLEKKEKAKILSRWIQNLRLFKKFKNKVKVIGINKDNKKEVQSLLIVLGLPTKQVKDAVK